MTSLMQRFIDSIAPEGWQDADGFHYGPRPIAAPPADWHIRKPAPIAPPTRKHGNYGFPIPSPQRPHHPCSNSTDEGVRSTRVGTFFTASE